MRRTATKCNGCGIKFDEKESSHVDEYHRFTPLCEACYYNDEIRKRTEYKLGDEMVQRRSFGRR